MLKLIVRVKDDFDPKTQTFDFEDVEIELEHSLASLSKWEEIWEIPLLSSDEKTAEQNLSYVECMCVTPNVPSDVFHKLTETQHKQISDYLNKKHTATFFAKKPEKRSNQIITAEVIYYWIYSYRIDSEVQYWNLNKLFTLLKVFSEKAQAETSKKRRQTNSDRLHMANVLAQRRVEHGSNG